MIIVNDTEGTAKAFYLPRQQGTPWSKKVKRTLRTKERQRVAQLRKSQ